MLTEGQADLAHPDAADWVLGTLEPARSEEFQRHLTSCGHCQVAVAEFGYIGWILQHLPPAVEPPPDLEARTIASVLAAVGDGRMETQVHQIPEVSPAAAEPGAPAQATQIPLPPPELASLYRASPGTRRHVTQRAGDDEPTVATAEVLPSPRRRRRPGLYAIAGAVVAAIIAAVVIVPRFRGSTSADATVVIPLHSTSGTAATGRATARHMPGGWSIQLSVHGLKPLAPGEFYQCWLAEAGNKPSQLTLISAGTFSTGRSGSVNVSTWSAADPRQFRSMEITTASAGDASQRGRVILSGVART